MYVFHVFLWYTISNWKNPKGFKGQHVNRSASSCAKSTAKDDQSCGVKTTWQKLADLQQSPTTEKPGISKYVYNIYIIRPYIYVEYILCSLNFMFRMFKDFMVYFIYFSWKSGLNHPGYSAWENHLSSSRSSSGNRRDSDCLLTKSTLWQAFISVWRDVTTSIRLPICWLFRNVWKMTQWHKAQSVMKFHWNSRCICSCWGRTLGN